MSKRSRIGIVGFGKIGQYLYKEVKQQDYGINVDFVWNRSFDKISHLPEEEVLKDLNDFASRDVDLIVEVAHLSITHEFGERFLEKCDFMIGSPTALADASLEEKLRVCANKNGLYVPAGAFWGGEDIKKMACQGSLKALKVTMKKHPSSFKVLGELAQKLETVDDKPLVLYEGPVRPLCPLAPSNVNTMACAAIAALNLGFDVVQGCLIADKSLNTHIVEIDVTGPCSGSQGEAFTVKTVRTNPCGMGAVTGNATYASFLQSMTRAHGNGPGVHLC